MLVYKPLGPSKLPSTAVSQLGNCWVVGGHPHGLEAYEENEEGSSLAKGPPRSQRIMT